MLVPLLTVSSFQSLLGSWLSFIWCLKVARTDGRSRCGLRTDCGCGLFYRPSVRPSVRPFHSAAAIRYTMGLQPCSTTLQSPFVCPCSRVRVCGRGCVCSATSFSPGYPCQVYAILYILQFNTGMNKIIVPRLLETRGSRKNLGSGIFVHPVTFRAHFPIFVWMGWKYPIFLQNNGLKYWRA